MSRPFRILLIINALLIGVILIYQPSGEDPAGVGMRLGLAVFYGIAVCVIVALHQLVKARWFRIAMLVLLALPLLALAYGLALSV